MLATAYFQSPPQESGARIEISKTETEGAKAGEPGRTVYISGLQDAVDKAKKLIDDAIEKACTLKVPHELIGMLIGRGGETIKDLKKESGARIDIAKEADEEGSTDRQVHITGPPECVEFAKKMIEDMLGKSRESREGKDGQRKPGGRVIKVPTDMIGVLIGRGGETISKIQRESSARIEIHKDDREALDRQVTITGSADNVEKAIRAIDDVLDGAERAGKGSRRRRDHDSGGDEGALVPLDRKPSPVRDSSWLSEKVYIDEVEMPYRPNYLPDHEDGMGTDLEIFVRGLPKVCAERDLWEHLYRLGATDVKEILLLRRQKQSKGMAYVVFNRHDHAVIAKNKLQGTPASSIPCGGELQTEEKQSLYVRFSESERCINGRSNVYGADMAVLLQGPRGRAMQEVREASGLKKVTLTGRSMKGYGQVDEDPRMHLVVYYDADGADDVVKAIEVWGKQLGEIHREIVERSKGKGKGKGWPWMPPPHYFDGRAPMMPHPYGPPPPHLMHHPPHMGPAPEPAVEAPVLLVRRKILEAEDGKPPELSKEKVIEATSLRGRELRWQPWPEVGKFNGDWKVTPLRWGLRGELFVLLRHRESGETRVCAAEVQSPVEKWPVLHTNAASSSQPSARYKSFTFNEHLFVISIDRESGILKVFHVPDPSSSWNVAFETTLPEDPSERQDFPLSRRAKLCIFYAMDRTPYAVAVEPKAEEGDRIASVFRIADPAKAWTLCAERPALPPKVRLLMVYTKARSPNPTEFEASLFAIDANAGEMKVFQVPSDMDKPWNQAGSPTEKMQKLCHLNLMEWRMHKQAPVVEEKFSRPMSSLWHVPQLASSDLPSSKSKGELGLGEIAQVVALPIDCTADLAVSRHTWVSLVPLVAALIAQARGGGMFNPTRIWRRWHRRVTWAKGYQAPVQVNVTKKRHAVAVALAASSLPPLVMARGHRIGKVAELPLVVSDGLESVTKTKQAVESLKKLGCGEELQKVLDSKKIRAGKGKARNRRFVRRLGPLVIYNEDNGIVRAMRNVPGVETVDRLNLLRLAPGGAFGRFLIFTESAFKRLSAIYGTRKGGAPMKKGYTLPRAAMANADLARIINSTEVQSVLRPKIEPPTFSKKRNALKSKEVMEELNPGSTERKAKAGKSSEKGTAEFNEVQKQKKARIDESKKYNKTNKKGDETFYKTLMKAFEARAAADAAKKAADKKEAEGGEDLPEKELLLFASSSGGGEGWGAGVVGRWFDLCVLRLESTPTTQSDFLKPGGSCAATQVLPPGAEMHGKRENNEGGGDLRIKQVEWLVHEPDVVQYSSIALQADVTSFNYNRDRARLDARRPPFDMPPGCSVLDSRKMFCFIAESKGLIQGMTTANNSNAPDAEQGDARPPGPFDARPPFEGGRPPFEAPPGDWFGGKGKGKGPPPGAPPGAAITDGAPADGAEGEGHRRRRHRHRRGEEGDGEGRKRRRAERAEAQEAEGAPMDAPPGDVQAPADAPPGDVQAPAATDGAEPERKRHRRRHKDPDKDRSKSREDGERKHRRRRRRGEGDDPGS
ncbi:RPL4A [Symbiodinium sp. KB8]|nr:RPL4A [Symbiodinium sp. KB8]